MAVQAKKVTDEMLLTAARTLAGSVKQESLDMGQLYPDVRDLRSISITIAREVAKKAVGSGVSEMKSVRSYPAHIIGRIWNWDN